jgi:excisionase family DNA binding protein
MSLPEIPNPPKKKKMGRPPHPRPEAQADTITEFCAKMKCSRPTVYRMMKDGELKYIQIRGERRIPHSEYGRLGLPLGPPA